MEGEKSPTGTEIELKLQVRSEDLPLLRDSPLLSPPSAGAAGPRTLESVYFDTADLRLRRKNMTLRVRKQGRHYVQTVKSNGRPHGGALHRGEWEAPLASAAPDVAAITAEMNGQLGRLRADELRPVFASHIKRTIRHLGNAAGKDGAAIEVAFDEGEIRTPDGAALPVSEVELELKSGDPAALYDLALALSEIAPLRVESRSKSERGYALVDGAARLPVHAAPIELTPDMTVEDALATIIRQCFDHLVNNERLVLLEQDALALHQMRVALRRMRSALSVFRSLLPPAQYDLFAGEIKWLAGTLAAAREWDVFLGELVSPVRGHFAQDASLAMLEGAARDRRAVAYRAASEAIASARYTTLLLKIGAWLDGKGWRQQPVSERSAMLLSPVVTLADRLLAERRKRALKRGAHFARQTASRRHDLRVALKKLRYATEFFRSLYDRKSVQRYLRHLTELQSGLGHLNDVASATDLVTRLKGEGEAALSSEWGDAAGKVIGWHARDLCEFEPRLRKDWKAFARTEAFWSTPE
ncbi:MAG TPA: CHAD domain-containing protein [Stellaceae bacterium]|jgi:inorganic triphosphatase YgiF|nr:CHAD domain-containing protein [Stellaceae bacterium]